MPTCPHCRRATNQVKAGLHAGNQRYKCTYCERRYVYERRTRGYPAETRKSAVELMSQGKSISAVARMLDVDPGTISKWARAGADVIESVRDGEPTEKPTVAGRLRPTISDVARHAGVGRSTISNYLNDKGRMSEETRTRIRSAIEHLHFTPNALMRSIHARRTNILGVMIFGLSSLDTSPAESLTSSIIAGISTAAYDAERNILLFTGLKNYDRQVDASDLLNGHVDGVIWVVPNIIEPALVKIAAAGLPSIGLLARHVPDSVGFINVDNIGAMEAVVDHLVSIGRRRIAYAGSHRSSNFVDRDTGYRSGLTKSGMPFDPAIAINTLEWSLSIEQCIEAVSGWLKLPAPPDAIICSTDGTAANMIEACGRLGLSVPHDIAITGFDGLPNSAGVGGGLTTIRQPFRMIGELGAKKLMAMIEGAPVEQCRITLPWELIIRNTTVPCSAPAGEPSSKSPSH